MNFIKDGKSNEKPVDFVILVTGQKKPSFMSKISKLFGVDIEDGFCKLKSFSCSETDKAGIFAVGELTGPKGNPEVVWHGLSAFTEILKYLGKPNFKPFPPPPLKDFSGQIPKVGVFICSCFGKFNEKMDLEKLKEKIGADVSHVEIIKGCCTPETMQETAEKIKKSGVNRVVLAACTPLQKLLKYRKTVMMAGINPLLCEFLRLREDVINVHEDREKMLGKALILINYAIEKVKRARQASAPLSEFKEKALVIGGGVSGIIAAWEIAEKGYPVVIVEKKEKIGGMKDYLNEEERIFIHGLMEKLKGKENVRIYTKCEVEDVKGYAGNYTVIIKTNEGTIEKIEVSVIFIATGAKEYEPKGFLYNEDKRVLTQSELKRKIEKEKFSGKVAMIQCVGSRNEEHSYCSRICCTQALKNAISLKNAGCDVIIFFRDITYYGKNDLYKIALDKGIKFIRFEEKRYPEVQRSNNKIFVTTNEFRDEFDFIILSTGIVPDLENNKKLSKLLNYPLDEDGFFANDVSGYPFEEAIKKLLKPFELATNCIYPIGFAHSPRSFEERMLITKDAVGRAIVLLGKKKQLPPNAMYIAGVIESLCMGCGMCVDVCPYSARYIDNYKKIAVVIPFLCDACGSCVAICPNNASYLRDFKGEQTISSLDALLT